jgi:hypothetical protein
MMLQVGDVSVLLMAAMYRRRRRRRVLADVLTDGVVP